MPNIFYPQMKIVFKVVALVIFQEILSFLGYLPCIKEVYMLLNFCFSFVDLSLIQRCLSQEPRIAEGKLFFLPLHSKRLCHLGCVSTSYVVGTTTKSAHFSEYIPISGPWLYMKRIIYHNQVGFNKEYKDSPTSANKSI